MSSKSMSESTTLVKKVDGEKIFDNTPATWLMGFSTIELELIRFVATEIANYNNPSIMTAGAINKYLEKCAAFGQSKLAEFIVDVNAGAFGRIYTGFTLTKAIDLLDAIGDKLKNLDYDDFVYVNRSSLK